MGVRYPACDFRLRIKDHSRRKDMEDDVKEFLKLFNLLDVSKVHSSYITLTSFTSKCYAESEYSERLLLVNRLFVLWFIIDEIREEKDVTDDGKEFHDECIHLFEDESKVQTHSVLKALQKVLLEIKERADPVWYSMFKDSCIQCAVFSHEMAYERPLSMPEYPLAVFGRILDGCALPVFTLQEFVTQKYVPAHIRENAEYFLLLSHASMVTVLFNELVSCEKKTSSRSRRCSVSESLQNLQRLNTQEAVNELHRMMMENFRKFMDLRNTLDKCFEGEELETMQDIGRSLHRIIQGNKDYCYEAGFMDHLPDKGLKNSARGLKRMVSAEEFSQRHRYSLLLRRGSII